MGPELCIANELPGEADASGPSGEELEDLSDHL